MAEKEMILEWMFWISILELFYVYLGYPILLWIVAKLKPKPIRKSLITPNVSVIIAAYNEEDVIQQRLENLLASNYPKDKMEIIVSSDGSTDRTNEIVRKMEEQHENIHLIASTQRKGKLAALNKAVPYAEGEILIFTDANTEFDSDAIKFLTQTFTDEKIGCVAGRKVIYEITRKGNEKAEGLYWKYEHFLKQKESLIHSCIGADGSIYALRKELYDFPDESRGYADDCRISLGVVAKGYRLVYEGKAKAFEPASSSLWREYKRKIRTLSGGLEGVVDLHRLLIPFRSPIWWQLWSHRLLRFAIPGFLALALISSGVLVLSNTFYASVFFLQILAYFLGLGGLLGNKHMIFRLSAYLTFMNFVFISAFWRFLRRQNESAWEKLGR